jgi:hypothetical protein
LLNKSGSEGRAQGEKRSGSPLGVAAK